MTAHCRLCNRTVHQVLGWLERVNEKGVPGIWECRPHCGDVLPVEDAIMGAITGEAPKSPNPATPDHD